MSISSYTLSVTHVIAKVPLQCQLDVVDFVDAGMQQSPRIHVIVVAIDLNDAIQSLHF